MDRLLARILATPDSRLAWLLQHQLAGLATTLERAAGDAPGDPSATDCRELAARLARAVRRADAAPAGDGFPWGDAAGETAVPTRPVAAVDPAAAPAAGLPFHAIPELASAGPRLAALLPAGRWPPVGDAEREALYLAALTLEPTAADTLAKCLAALPEGTRGQPATVAAGPEALVLVPGPGGLRIDPAAPPDPRIAALADDWEGAAWERDCVRRLTPFVSLWLTLTARAPALVHCLGAVSSHGLAVLAGDQRALYEQALITRFHALGAVSRDDLPDRVRAWVRLDEALNALLCKPLADRGSRWAVWKWDARKIVLDWANTLCEQGARVLLRTLPDEYAQSRHADLTRIANDIPLAGGPIGTVLATIRLWSQADGRIEQGRALYGNG